MSINELNVVKNKAIAHLKNLESLVENVQILDNLELKFSFNEIKKKEDADKIIENIKDFQNSLDSKNHIYILQLEDKSPEALSDLKYHLEKAKIKHKGKISFSRILKQENPLSIYVGSSSTILKSRLNNHLGYGYKGTFSLHLSEWLPDTDQIIKLKILKLSKEMNLDLLQLIEDFYWEEYLPIFGKKGGK